MSLFAKHKKNVFLGVIDVGTDFYFIFSTEICLYCMCILRTMVKLIYHIFMHADQLYVA